MRDFHAGSLPTPNVDLLKDNWFTPSPGGHRPTARRPSIERSVRLGFGSEISEVVRFHDRQLQSWLKTNVARIVELYEVQASAFREQIRRLGAEAVDGGAGEAQAELEADLRTLRQDDGNAVVGLERPGMAPAT